MGKSIDGFKRSRHSRNSRIHREIEINKTPISAKSPQNKQLKGQSVPIHASVLQTSEASLPSPGSESQKMNSKSKKRRVAAVVVACLIALFTLGAFFAPPSLAITSSFAPQTGNSYSLSGKVKPGDVVLINDRPVEVANGTFNAEVGLAEGNNDIKVVVQSGSKKTEKVFKVYRFTAAELAEQKRIANEKQMREEAAKKEADLRQAQQLEQKQKEAEAEKQRQQELLQQQAVAQQKAAQEAAAAAEAARPQSGNGYINVDGNYVPSPSSDPAGATAKCRDGTYSYSQNRRGTCSHHGGVLEWL